MTDPHDVQEFDNILFSDANETNLTSPAISISSASETLRTKVTNQTQSYTAQQSDRDTQLTDPADPPLDTRPGFQHDQLRYPTVPGSDFNNNLFLATGSFDADDVASRNLAHTSFGSPSWVTPTSRYFSFNPPLIEESARELVDESSGTFNQSDIAATVKNPAISASNRNPLRSLHPTTTSTTASISASVNAFAQPSLPRSALKRKADTIESIFAEASAYQEELPSKVHPGIHRTVSFERMSGRGPPTSPDEGSQASERPSGQRGAQNSAAQSRRTRQAPGSSSRTQPNAPAAAAVVQPPSRPNRGSRAPSGHPPSILPPEKVFPIQIGSDLFRLSGASISSDAPSYFTQFFEEQIRQNEESGGVRTLYIDRDPNTFRDVARHLQGYYVKPIDGSHFVKLFADAQFYSLPRLIDQLFESEIFIQIGERHFQIPKDIFSEPGNSPNFFSLGFAVFFSTPGEVFPGLDRRGLLRPPSITPPYVPGRSAEIFSELLHLLRGYPLHIRNDAHRAELLRDCRYFHLRGLEQKLIAHEVSYNADRQRHEISLRLEDVKPSGVSFKADEPTQDQKLTGGWVFYARPFVDDTSHEMVLEVGGECTILDLNDMKADFHNLAKARISSLLQVIANKMNLSTNAPLGLMMLSGGQSSQSSPRHTPLSEDRVKIRFDPATDITLDGKPCEIDWDCPQGQVMAHGPPAALEESDSDSEVMSDAPSTSPAAQISPPTKSPAQQSRPRTRQTPASSTGQPTLTVPPLQTTRLARPSAKKRKRQDSQDADGEWIVRTAQWRLRVQPNPQDTIRGGFEVVLIGVKIDAYTSEKARNARRVFLA